MWPIELQPESFEIVNKDYNKTFKFGCGDNKYVNIESTTFRYGPISAVWEGGIVFYDSIEHPTFMLKKFKAINDGFSEYICFTDKEYYIKIPEVARGYFVIKNDKKYFPGLYSDNHIYLVIESEEILTLDIDENTVKPKILKEIIENCRL